VIAAGKDLEEFVQTLDAKLQAVEDLLAGGSPKEVARAFDAYLKLAKQVGKLGEETNKAESGSSCADLGRHRRSWTPRSASE